MRIELGIDRQANQLEFAGGQVCDRIGDTNGEELNVPSAIKRGCNLAKGFLAVKLQGFCEAFDLELKDLFKDRDAMRDAVARAGKAREGALRHFPRQGDLEPRKPLQPETAAKGH